MKRIDKIVIGFDCIMIGVGLVFFSLHISMGNGAAASWAAIATSAYLRCAFLESSNRTWRALADEMREATEQAKNTTDRCQVLMDDVLDDLKRQTRSRLERN